MSWQRRGVVNLMPLVNQCFQVNQPGQPALKPSYARLYVKVVNLVNYIHHPQLYRERNYYSRIKYRGPGTTK